jgi:hypothetical protein
MDSGVIPVLTYLLGPILAVFPKRWRRALPGFLSVEWQRAGILSGIAEAIAAIIASAEWYFHGLAKWVDNGVGAAMDGKMTPQVTTHEIAGAAYFVWITHPLTWVIGYFIVEGTVRLVAAAFTENVHGILPLYLVESVFAKIFLPNPRKSPDMPDPVPGGTSSHTRTLRDRMLTAMVPEAADELRFAQSEDGETLEIRASRTKPDWSPPRVVRYSDAYYRLEACSRGMGSRPFVYRLRRLSAGVPGRNVLLYKPEDALIREKL